MWRAREGELACALVGRAGASQMHARLAEAHTGRTVISSSGPAPSSSAARAAVDGERDHARGVLVDQQLAGGHFGEGRGIPRGAHGAGVAHGERVTGHRAERDQLLIGGVEDQVAERVAAQDVHGEGAVCHVRRGQPNTAQLVDGQLLPDGAQRLPRGERGGYGREDVATVERARDGPQPLGRFADVDRLGHAGEPLGGRHQEAVVRAHEQVVLLDRADRHRATRVAADRADPRVDHRQVHPRGQERQRRAQHDRPRAHVVARNSVRQVDHPRARAATGHDAVTHADELIELTVVGEEGDDGRAVGHCLPVLPRRTSSAAIIPSTPYWRPAALPIRSGPH